MTTMLSSHTLPNGSPITFSGEQMFLVQAFTSDGQTAAEVIAADDEWSARTRLMAVQTTMQLNGQDVTYEITRQA